MHQKFQDVYIKEAVIVRINCVVAQFLFRQSVEGQDIVGVLEKLAQNCRLGEVTECDAAFNHSSEHVVVISHRKVKVISRYQQRFQVEVQGRLIVSIRCNIILINT